jgi:CheY-like chemotaxis protein
VSDLRLLYVDDEPDIREVVQFALDLDPGIEVRAYSAGADALAALGAETWRPNVILLDVMMPDMDGPTTLLRMRGVAGLEATPAIFITARAQPHERQAFLDRGAIGVVTKPFDPMSLAKEIRALLAAQ